jgi:uncharacterized protein
MTALSIAGALHPPGSHGPVHRIESYVATMAMELAMFAWVLVGLRLRRTPLRLLLGDTALRPRAILSDLGAALVFWIGSLMVLATLAVAWTGIETAITHRQLIDAHGKPLQPSAAQQGALETLKKLAPSNGEEIAAWALLCIVAGFVEETVFRGYLLRQFTAWGSGRVAVGVVFSSLAFGAAHGYEGARTMFLIAVFGVLFCLLALVRRGLRPGMIAHCWQDFFVGAMIAWLQSRHLI